MTIWRRQFCSKVLILLGVFLWSLALFPPPSSAQTQLNVYAVKFVIGNQKLAGNRVTPANYLTSINIHNPNTSTAIFYKKGILLKPGQIPTPPGEKVKEELGPDFAMDMSAKDIQVLLGLVPNTNFKTGFVVFECDKVLDIVAVYTSQGVGGQDSCIEVETIKPNVITIQPPG